MTKIKKIDELTVGVIGCGLIGLKRAYALNKKQILGCYDIDKNKSQYFSKKFLCKSYENENELIHDKRIKVLFICTFHDSLKKLLLKGISSKKYILVEKPAAKNFSQISDVLKRLKKNSKIKIHVGYNHRFHPSVILAKKLIKSNSIGSILYIRARYGHGARLNYEKEWRMDRKISGGGELIDQGSHLIDLSRLFLGEFVSVKSSLRKYFWKSDGKVDDNAFLILSTKKNKIAFLHCSCTEWKNKFSFEIFGEKGKIEINGLGKSYGTENLTLYKMKKKMGIPNIKNWKFSNKKDMSWKSEINDFFLKIIQDKPIESNINNASKNLKIIDKCYKSNVLGI